MSLLNKQLNFDSANIAEQSQVSQFLTTGNQELTITGYEEKLNNAGDKVQVIFHFESKPTKGLVAHETAKKGGQIGKMAVGIYFDPNNDASTLTFVSKLKQIASAVGKSEEFDTLDNTLIAKIEGLVELMKDSYAHFLVGGEAYIGKNKEQKPVERVKIVLPNFGFVSSEADKLKPFDKTNIYHFKPLTPEQLALIAQENGVKTVAQEVPEDENPF